MDPGLTGDALRFGRYELQPGERRLLADGQPVAIGARAFDLLVALVSRQGRLVTKNELLEAVWPGLVVEEANLAVQVSGLRKVLGGDLIATVPGHGYRFTARVGSAASAETPGPASLPPASAPSAPELVGRDEELAQLRPALASPGCITLVGAAGVGKTSLARVLAAGVEGGAVWVDLAALSDGAQLGAAAARAMGAGSGEDASTVPGLLRALCGRLLVLDNAEHVIDAVAALVAQLFTADRTLRVMATSQAPLAVAGERVFRVEPLALPHDDDPLDLHCGAVALFVERARAADQRFRPGPEQLPLLRQICRRLDGLPLALEMAAARVNVLGLVGLARALERPLSLLNAGRRDGAARHRTLQAALDWSHDLLSPAEQRLYRTCGVFTGGCTLDLLVEVARPPGPASAGVEAGPVDDEEQRWGLIDTLAQLVDRSLVATDALDPPRYRLLETMRADALQRLAACGEEEAVRERHARALLALVQRGRAHDAGMADRAQAMAEHANLREAIAWALPRLPELAVSMALATCGVATFSPWRRDALAWLESCESAVETGALPGPLRVRWWRERSRQRLMSRDPRARAMAERACELTLELGDELAEFDARSNVVRASMAPEDDTEPHLQAMRALLARHPEWPPVQALLLAGAEAVACELRQDHEGMLRHCLRQHELALQQGRQAEAEAVDTNIVHALQRLGRNDEALQRVRAVLARIADPLSANAAYAWNGLLSLLIVLGRYDEFRTAAPAAAQVLRRHGLPYLANQYALALAREGRAEAAARMVGYARKTFEACGVAVEGAAATDLANAERLVRQRLDEGLYATLEAAGRLLDDAAADRLVLQSPMAAAID